MNLVDRLTRTGLGSLATSDPGILKLAERELARQRSHLNLVAASSPTSPEVLAAQGLGLGALTAEGYPGRRYHPGTEVIDEVEQLAIERAKWLFGADHANVQPLSASVANLAVLYGFLAPGDAVLSMELSHGGHLSHVARPTSASKHLNATYYRLGADGSLDLERVREQALAVRPAVLICGGSAYPRTVDFSALRAIADEVGALLLGDISHISGLVAAGLHPSPFPHCDVVTTSTYKQLRGPHGGLILRSPGSRLSANEIDKFIFPGFQGTPDFGTVAAKAVALGGALRPEFRKAMDRVVCFAKLFADAFTEYGVRLIAGGTDTHMVLVDLSDGDASGKTVSHALEQVGILTNMNLIPDDRRSAHETSGLRLGTNHLAFMDIGEHQVSELARGVAELVADLDRGRLPEQCPAWRRLGEHAAALTGSGHPPEVP
ncbi:MAG: serine hydroxymethyltransferase [Pseudonocardiaceae bacterium]